MVKVARLLPGRVEAQAHKMAAIGKREGIRTYSVDIRNGAFVGYSVEYDGQWHHLELIDGEWCECLEVK